MKMPACCRRAGLSCALLVLAALGGCAGAPPETVHQPANPTSLEGELAETSATRYRVGDFVEYRYSGASLQGPVLLREQIAAREGDRLRIDVEATRGAERRVWVQVVTDTPENQQNNVIDALFELRGDRLERVSNENNADIFRLYEWMILMPDGAPTDIETTDCAQLIAEREYRCTCVTGRNQWKGRAIGFEQSACPDFLWTNGPARFFDQETGEDLLRVEVGAAGRQEGAPEVPLEPAP